MDWSTFSIGNAAGFVKEPNARFEDLLRSPITTETVIGSFCIHGRPGNSGDVYWFDQETKTSYNSMGLPCRSATEALDLLPFIRRQVNETNKELWVSVAGFSPEENVMLAERFSRYADGIEWNASCPNTWGAEGKKPIASLEPALFRAVLEKLRCVGKATRLRVKISPAGVTLVHDLAKVVNEAGFVEAVVATNTYPNQVPRKSGGEYALSYTVPDIEGVHHAGGMGGRALKVHSLETVHELRKALVPSIRVIGCGGIFEGQDVLDYYSAGASGVQVGTAFGEYGAKIFSDVMQEASDLVG